MPLTVRAEMPFNAETPLGLLRQRFVTPEGLFFVRNHATVPDVDSARYRFSVSGLVQRPLSLSLDEIRHAFPTTTVTATLQCAGNRRTDLLAIAPIPGEVPWDAGAIGNAEWTGVALREILQAAGVRPGARHAAFTGLDQIGKDGHAFGFGGSIPMAKALSEEVLLAYEMNGELLTPLHGFPLRVIVPGYIGARSVKWLAEITVQDQPSTNYFQAHAYKLFPPHVGPETVDWATGLSLGESPVNAVICCPADGEVVQAGPVLVQGFAIAGGGRTIERVDLSTDDGDTWVTAHLVGDPHPWSWRFWEGEVNLVPGPARIAARAWDSAAQTQPEDVRKIWNFKGYMNNAWHRVALDVTSPSQ